MQTWRKEEGGKRDFGIYLSVALQVLTWTNPSAKQILFLALLLSSSSSSSLSRNGHSPPLRKVTGSALLGERYFAFLSCCFSAEGAPASCKFVARLLQGGVAARQRSDRLFLLCPATCSLASPRHNRSGEQEFFSSSGR